MDQSLNALEEEMKDRVSEFEHTLWLITEVHSEKTTNRTQAIEHVQSVEAALANLNLQERDFVEQYGGPPDAKTLQNAANELTPLDRLFSRAPWEHEMSRRRDELIENGNEEYKSLRLKIKEASLRARLAREEQQTAHFDVEQDRTVVRQLIAILRDRTTESLNDLAASYDQKSAQKSREIRKLTSNFRDSVSAAAHRKIKMFSPMSEITPADVRRARVAAKEEFHVIQEVFSENS